jgi:hypothetical protein
MADNYFSERELGTPPRNKEKIDQRFWNEFRTFVDARMSDGSFAEKYPLNCPNAHIPVNCDRSTIAMAFQGDFSSEWFYYSDDPPETLITQCLSSFCLHLWSSSC